MQPRLYNLQIFASVFAVVMIERLGRRMLLISSMALMSLSNGGLGVYFFLDESERAQELGWLPLLCLIIFIVAWSYGVAPLAWIMNVELFPREAQSTLPTIGIMANWISTYLVVKFSPNIESVIGTWGNYFMFCGLCALGLLFCILCVPETKGKTPEDMKKYFSKHAKNVDVECYDNPACSNNDETS